MLAARRARPRGDAGVDDDDDIAMSYAGIIGSVAISCAPTEARNVAACLAAQQGVELAAFADSCLDGAAYPVSTEDAIRNVAVMQAIAESAAAQGAWQLLP